MSAKDTKKAFITMRNKRLSYREIANGKKTLSVFEYFVSLLKGEEKKFSRPLKTWRIAVISCTLLMIFEYSQKILCLNFNKKEKSYESMTC